MVRKLIHLVISVVIVAVCTAIGAGAASFTADPPRNVELTIYAQRYHFEPPVVRLNRGDKVSINIITRDVTHGFYLEGYDIDAKIQPKDASDDSTLLLRHPSKGGEYREVDRIVFVADRPGKFRFRCSQTCGYMHPFMQGELIVRPNYPLWGGIGLVTGLVIAAFVAFVAKPNQTLAVAPAEQAFTSGTPDVTATELSDET